MTRRSAHVRKRGLCCIRRCRHRRLGLGSCLTAESAPSPMSMKAMKSFANLECHSLWFRLTQRSHSRRILDATSVRHLLAEADKAAVAGNHARPDALRRTYLDRVPKGLDRVLFKLVTAPSLGPVPKLNAALRQIAIIECLGTALGKTGGKRKPSANAQGETPPGSSSLPPAPGSAGS